MLALNICSGQRAFAKPRWTNVDIQPRWNPDVLCDCRDMPMFADGSADCIVIHHGLEHFGLGEADECIKECFRILAPSGSLIVTVPDLMRLAKARIRREIDDYTYCVNLYGAYMGDEADRHKWGFSAESLHKMLTRLAPWREVKSFDFRAFAGADIAHDWWILGMEAVK